MKKNIANGKAVRQITWLSSNKVIILYDDFSKQEMTRITYNQIIKEQK